MSTLHTRLHDLATSFADDVLAAIRTASIEELTGAKDGGGHAAVTRGTSAGNPKAVSGRLARRSPEEIEKTLGLVLAALKVGPMRAEDIKSKLGIDKRELPRVLAFGLETKKLKKKGQKRATTYSAA